MTRRRARASGSSRSLGLLLACATAACVTAACAIGAAAQESPEAPRLNPLRALAPSDFQAFRERPLFTPARRPPPVVPSYVERAPAPVAATEAPPDVRLTGVVQGPGAAMAVLQRADAGARSTVRIGDAVDGWIVTAIDAVGVRLSKGAEAREYRLFARDSIPVSGPDQAAAAPSR